MSTMWGYVCTAHTPELASDMWFNHGDDKLRQLLLQRSTIVSLPDDVELDPDSDAGRVAWWFEQHPTCKLLLRDEYGNTIDPAVGEPEPTTRPPGTWVAYYYDGSAFVPFGDGDAGELAAHRHALSLSMNVKWAAFGDEDWMRR